MKLLAIDTATEACSVALLIDDECHWQYQVAPRQHNQLIFPMMETVLAESGVRMSELDALAFGRGPGSFTGVRIAASTIQGLAMGLDKPVVAVSTLQAMAQGAERRWSAQSVLVAIDARLAEVYWGCYQQDEQGIMLPVCEEQVVAPECVVLPQQASWTAVGTGWQTYAESLRSQVASPLTAIHPEHYPHASDIAYLAKLAYQSGDVLAAEDALPVYLRNKVTN